VEDDVRPNIFPALRYTDGHAAIDWLERAFGFERHVVFDGPGGAVAHAELRFGASAVGVSSRHQPADDNPWTHVRQGVYVRVDAVDALHDRAQAAGAAIALPPRDQDYGARDFSVWDLERHLWSFGTYDMAAGPGEPSLFVGLYYRDGLAALSWLEHAFGFARTLEVPGADGTVMHAELRLGDGVIMVDSGPRTGDGWGGNDQAVHVVLADPDAHYARATAAGAQIVMPLHDTPWGSRGYYARDLDGFLWGFSTYKPAGINTSSSAL
jgi:uncharacterized glyoxalase superfamily protein PhnB